MLKTPKDYVFDTPKDSTSLDNYKISPNDILEFNMYSNDGFKLVDLTSLNNSNTSVRMTNDIRYHVESDGFVKIPIIGRTEIAGKTIREAESFLEDKYAAFYVRPYVKILVLNKRVIIFPGDPGAAKVINLENDNTSLIEGLALAGGITENGKARVVKLIRDKDNKHEVYLIDLSTISGIKQATMVLQANDIIYVEPRRRYASKFLGEATPVITILTSTFVIFTYSKILLSK